MKSSVKRLLALCGVLALMMAMAVPAFASGSPDIPGAVSTALATVESDALTLIATVLPYALAIMGAILVVTIGVRAFKRASK